MTYEHDNEKSINLWQASIEDLEASRKRNSPAAIYKPELFVDGDKWCALYGENLQDGVAGFGDTPEEAMKAFNKEWKEGLAKSTSSKKENISDRVEFAYVVSGARVVIHREEDKRHYIYTWFEGDQYIHKIDLKTFEGVDAYDTLELCPKGVSACAVENAINDVSSGH